MDLQATTPTSTLLDDAFVIENFFGLKLIADLWQELEQFPAGEDFVDQHGIFKGQLIANQTFIDSNKAGICLTEILKKVRDHLGIPVTWREIDFVKLYLPWDIHCDLVRSDADRPFYNALIPLHDVDSRTVIFNETSPGYNHFWQYKNEHAKSSNPVPRDVWDKYLSMCWPEDREYLSVKSIMPVQRAGQLIMFKRNLWHSSDSFYLSGAAPKYFLQLIIDRDD